MARHRRHHRYDEDVRPERSPASGGFDLSNLATIANLVNTIDINKISGLLGGLANSGIVGNANNETREGDPEVTERKKELADALRTLINADKSELLQVALQFYVASRNNQNNINDNT